MYAQIAHDTCIAVQIRCTYHGDMAHESKGLRLFVAVYPPAATAQALLDQVQTLDLPPHRTVAAEQVHLTLQFIGDVDPRQLDDTIESVQRSAAGLHAFELTMQQLIVLPQRGRARLIAAETDQPPTLMEIQRRLAHRLARSPRDRPGDRFLPHMTLLRFRTPPKFKLDAARAAITSQPFAVQSIVLMRSTLRPDGAVHKTVQEILLDD